nr:MAG TPA: hypothetical protein [Caudoviricetes sp.]
MVKLCYGKAQCYQVKFSKGKAPRCSGIALPNDA